MAVPVFKEDELGKRWDRCLSDAVFKIVGGFGIGALSSLLLFKRRRWPIIMGSGFGFGLSYSNCQKDLSRALGYDN